MAGEPAVHRSDPWELVEDDPNPPPAMELVVVGCGNLLRGDDAVGPTIIRRLWDRGVPDGVRLVDGGTAGMDVAFVIRRAERVIIVDASATGSTPGTVFRLPPEALATLRPDPGVHSHSFRWDHAVGFARWMLGDEFPSDVSVLLIEAENLAPGVGLSAVVSSAAEEVIAMIEAEYPRAVVDPAAQVRISDAGTLYLDASLARKYFPSDAVGARCEPGVLLLFPLRGSAAGGLLLKQRNVKGDRAVLVRHIFDDHREPLSVGSFPAFFHDDRGVLVVDLANPTTDPDV